MYDIHAHFVTSLFIHITISWLSFWYNIVPVFIMTNVWLTFELHCNLKYIIFEHKCGILLDEKEGTWWLIPTMQNLCNEMWVSWNLINCMQEKSSASSSMNEKLSQAHRMSFELLNKAKRRKPTWPDSDPIDLLVSLSVRGGTVWQLFTKPDKQSIIGIQKEYISETRHLKWVCLDFLKPFLETLI